MWRRQKTLKQIIISARLWHCYTIRKMGILQLKCAVLHYYISKLYTPNWKWICAMCIIRHQCQDIKCICTFRKQELKEDMSAGKTRDALMKVFHQKLNFSVDIIRCTTSILKGESLWNTQQQNCVCKVWSHISRLGSLNIFFNFVGRYICFTSKLGQGLNVSMPLLGIFQESCGSAFW